MVKEMKISERLEKLIQDIHEMKVEQARQGVLHDMNTEDLKEHMARTDANEKRITLLENERRVAWFVVTTIVSGIIGLITLAKTLGLF